MPEDRRLAAIMFTDIVGYTSLMGSDEEKAFQILRKNRNIQKPIIKKFNGKWLKEMGDGILASFTTASDAVRCAGEIQKAAKKEGIGLRIGIHEGEVVFEGGDVLGDGVNVASRLEELAEEGTINISGAVYKDVKNKSGITAEYIGEKELKNVDEPVKIFKVKYAGTPQEKFEEKPSWRKKNKISLYVIGLSVLLIISVLIWLPHVMKENTPSGTKTKDKSIAVIPFENDSPDQKNEYICNGIMEDILTNLQKISDLKVKSRTDVEQYRDNKKLIAVMGEELGVAYILEGSVRKAGDNLRITAQLIDVETGDHLWANTYDGKYTDEIFKFQSIVAEKVASSLKAVITPEEEKTLEEVPTTNIEAYDLTKRGWDYLQRFQTTNSQTDFKTTVELFSKAISIDPEMAGAYAGLASIYMNAGIYDSLLYFVNKSLEINPNNGSAYHQRGYYYYFVGEADKAIADQMKSMELSESDYGFPELLLGITYCDLKNDFSTGIPHIVNAISNCGTSTQPLAYLILGMTLLNVGEYDLSKQYLEKAMSLKVGCYELFLQYMLMQSKGEFDKALELVIPKCNKNACDELCSWSLFNIYMNKGEFDMSERYYNQWRDSHFVYPMMKGWTEVNWGYVLFESGRKSESKELFDQLLTQSQAKLAQGFDWASLDISRIYAFQGKKEEALQYLREYERYGFQFGFHDYLMIDPLFKKLREDPDFIEFINQVKSRKAESRKQIQQLSQEGII